MRQQHKSYLYFLSQELKIEAIFDSICSENSSLTRKLVLKKLISELCRSNMQFNGHLQGKCLPDVCQELKKLKLNLSRRKHNSDPLTSSRLVELPEPCRAILMSDIAYAFRDEINDYTQIDFGNDKHVELLRAAVDSSISKVAGKQGRPVNEPLDEFFIGLRDLYEAATGKKAVATAHYNNEPKTDFEKLIYLGYQIIRTAQKYPSALKAYERAISRNS